MNKPVICEYNPQYKAALLSLLLKLQVDYFKETVPAQQQELSKAKDDRKAFSDYITFMEQQPEGWRILLAILEDKAVGMIIGSITTDDDLKLSPIGKIEDWFVEPDYRSKGLGAELYVELENWFKAKGCQQVLSDTWMDNKLSIEVHKQLGFFVTGIQFGKKL